MRSKHVIIILICMMVMPFSCSPVQQAGGETTNGNGIVALVKENRIDCSFDTSSEQGCRKLQLFEFDFNPQIPGKFHKEVVLTGNNLTFDSLNPGTYVLLARNTCISTAALLQNITINNSSTNHTIRASMLSTVTVKGIVNGVDTAHAGYVYLHGTDISSYCTSDGKFTLSFVPQGECTIIAMLKPSSIGSEKSAFDTLAIQVTDDTPSTTLKFYPVFTPDRLLSGTVDSITP